MSGRYLLDTNIIIALFADDVMVKENLAKAIDGLQSAVWQTTRILFPGLSCGHPSQTRSAGTATGSEVTYLHTDHLGTVSIATNASAQVLARTLNLPYGSVRWSSGAMPTDYAFTGQKEPIGTGLVYLHARFYAPFAGRFVSADTIVPEPGNPQTLNRLTYALSNPLRYIDPTGHEGCSSNDIGACSELDLLGLLGNQLQNLDWRWEEGFLKYWSSLLGQSQTGAMLINSLIGEGFSLLAKFDNSSISASGDTVRLEGNDWVVKIGYDSFRATLNEVLANGLREALKMPKEGHVRTWSLDNFNAYYASVIGHELFHVAVGDTSGERSVGDCEGSGTCMAYRVQAKILNEILYGGPRGYYLPNSRITGNDKGQWAYDQAALNYPGAIEFDRQFSTNKPYFRVDPNMIRALVVVAPPQSRP